MARKTASKTDGSGLILTKAPAGHRSTLSTTPSPPSAPDELAKKVIMGHDGQYEQR
ncbi:hypothetical protein [Nonomuraea terrae]|uniref:hypothetical protein n=1 Tax=Nonomuraea terrae TaxID=2530383 RepID=UPI001404FA4A|nr:hypothetical protein [Nonomuraea terrae]